jgi:vitamin B12 transporter
MSSLKARSARACAAAFLSLPALAQGEGASQQQTIVVTAARAEQPLPDALPSTRVISRTEIDAAQSNDLPALLRQLTSIDVAQTGPLGSQTSLFLRGADSRQVLVLIDGVPFARADFGTASWQYLPLDQIERIEIVRGNHSALYGAAAVGGVVHVITRRADTPQASVGLGTQGTRLASASGGTRFGAGETGTRLAASLSWRRTDGFSARDPAQDAGANPDRDGARQTGASARLEQGWAQGHRTQLALSASRTKSDYDGFTPDVADRLSTRVNTLALTTKHALGAGLTLDAEAGQTSERFEDPTGFTPEADNRVRNAAATLGWSATADHDLQLGAESRRDRYKEPGSAARTRTTDAVRLGWQGRFGAAWQVQAHARHDRSGVFGSATTGLAALAYTFAPGWKASVQASSGFSPPSFLDQAFAAPGAEPRPERSRQAEAALQWREGAASLRAALFVQRQRDRIDYDDTAGGYVNVARAKNRGLELMAQWPLVVGTLSGELTLQDPRNADTDVALPRRSKTAAALVWSGALDGWEPRVSVRHVGSRRDSAFSDDILPRRTTLALALAREVAPGWRLALAVDNATDSDKPEAAGYTAPPRSALLTLQATLR